MPAKLNLIGEKYGRLTVIEKAPNKGKRTQWKCLCDCGKEKVSRALASINKKDLDDIINDGESIEVKCQFCNQAYEFTVDDLKALRK